MHSFKIAVDYFSAIVLIVIASHKNLLIPFLNSNSQYIFYNNKMAQM